MHPLHSASSTPHHSAPSSNNPHYNHLHVTIPTTIYEIISNVPISNEQPAPNKDLRATIPSTIDENAPSNSQPPPTLEPCSPTSGDDFDVSPHHSPIATQNDRLSLSSSDEELADSPTEPTLPLPTPLPSRLGRRTGIRSLREVINEERQKERVEHTESQDLRQDPAVTAMNEQRAEPRRDSAILERQQLKAVEENINILRGSQSDIRSNRPPQLHSFNR